MTTLSQRLRDAELVQLRTERDTLVYALRELADPHPYVDGNNTMAPAERGVVLLDDDQAAIVRGLLEQTP